MHTMYQFSFWEFFGIIGSVFSMLLSGLQLAAVILVILACIKYLRTPKKPE